MIKYRFDSEHTYSLFDDNDLGRLIHYLVDLSFNYLSTSACIAYDTDTNEEGIAIISEGQRGLELSEMRSWTDKLQTLGFKCVKRYFTGPMPSMFWVFDHENYLPSAAAALLDIKGRI